MEMGKEIGKMKREMFGNMKGDEEKKKREANLIVHSLAEAGEGDRETFEDLVKTDLGVRGVEVIEVTRLRGREPGKDSNSNNKPASLLVRMRTAGQKWAIIGQAKKLRYAREEARRIITSQRQKE